MKALPLLTLAAVIIALFATANLPWTLDDYDQAKQAFVSYQTLGQHRWFFQTTPTEGLPSTGGRHSPYHISTKPPGIAWASAGIYLVSRSWDIAWRLPSFLSALILALLLFRLAQHTFGDMAALVALAAFGFNMLSPRLATLVRTDMPLALATFAIGAIIFTKLQTKREWQLRDRALLFAILTAGLFIKGPIIYAFTLPPLLSYQLWRRWRPDFPKVWPGWWPWVVSLGIFMAWVIAGVALVPGFYHDVIEIEFVGRFHEGVHRSQPLLFYLPHLLLRFAPWSLTIVALFLFLIRDQRRNAHLLNTVSPELLWLTVWALGGILAMSLLPSKRVDRIFPAIPPLCLLLAAQVNSLLQRTPRAARIYRMTAILIVLSGVFIGSYTACRVVGGYHQHRNALDKFGNEVRQLARTGGWRYEVLRAPDEGLLLYLQRPRFCSLQRAAELWRAGTINSLVARQNDLPEIGQWPGMATSPRLVAEKPARSSPTYVFITHDERTPPGNNPP